MSEARLRRQPKDHCITTNTAISSISHYRPAPSESTLNSSRTYSRSTCRLYSKSSKHCFSTSLRRRTEKMNLNTKLSHLATWINRSRKRNGRTSLIWLLVRIVQLSRNRLTRRITGSGKSGSKGRSGDDKRSIRWRTLRVFSRGMRWTINNVTASLSGRLMDSRFGTGTAVRIAIKRVKPSQVTDLNVDGTALGFTSRERPETQRDVRYVPIVVY
jgi:hypothetical protein